MMKKIAISNKPTKKSVPDATDALVENRDVGKPKKTKRLTIDIDESLHRRIKSKCAMNGTKIVDELRELLLQKYGEP